MKKPVGNKGLRNLKRSQQLLYEGPSGKAIVEVTSVSINSGAVAVRVVRPRNGGPPQDTILQARGHELSFT